MVLTLGIEPRTYGLKVRCSTSTGIRGISQKRRCKISKSTFLRRLNKYYYVLFMLITGYLAYRILPKLIANWRD